MSEHKIHFARLETSDRLRRVLEALQIAGSDGMTTLEIVQQAKVCAVNSAIAELRENGQAIDCTPEGRGRFRYRLRSAVTEAEADAESVRAEQASNYLRDLLPRESVGMKLY